MQSHQPMLSKVLATGDSLVRAEHFASPAIEAKCNDMSDAWDNINTLCNERKRKLDISLQKQKVGSLSPRH